MAAPLQQAVLSRLQQFPGLDPKAVLAVGSVEGLSGGIGDGGHAFGPFQLNNAGGVLTGKFAGQSPEQIQQWASSPQGIDYALAGIDKVAHGLKGQAAIDAIVSKFERPADIPGEIGRANSVYGGQPSGIPAQAPGGTERASMLDAIMGGGQAVTASAQRNLMGLVLQSSMSIAQGQPATMNPVVLGQLLGASTGTKDVSSLRSAMTGDPGAGQSVAAGASKYLGVPYVWGGTNPSKGLDCSAFVQAAMRDQGINIPRTTTQQFATGVKVDLKDIRPGDAVYTEPGAGPSGGPGHVGLYIGNGKIQESPHTGDVNKIVSLNDFLGGGIVGVRRFTK